MIRKIPANFGVSSAKIAVAEIKLQAFDRFKRFSAK
jgi:hypothetical protein